MLDHVAGGRSAGDRLHRQIEPAQVVEGVVVVDQPVEVTGAAQIAAPHLTQLVAELILGAGAVQIDAVGVAETGDVGLPQLVPVLPAAGAFRQPVDAGTVGTGG